MQVNDKLAKLREISEQNTFGEALGLSIILNHILRFSNLEPYHFLHHMKACMFNTSSLFF